MDSKGDTEGLGVVLLEAAMYRRPLVASRVGGILDVVEDGVTGLLVPEKDPRALADAIVKVLTDPDLARRLGQAGHDFVRRTFDWDAITGQMIEVYRSIRGMYELEGYAADATFMELAIVLHDHFKMVDGHYKTEGEKIVATLGRDHLKEMTDHLKSHAMLFLTPDESSELIHMIGSHHGRMNWGCVEEPRTASANLLHQLDMISAKCLGEWK